MLKVVNPPKNPTVKNNFKLTENANDEIEFAQKAKKEIEKVKNDLSEAIKNNDVKAIYKYFKTKVKEDENGYLTISIYKQPSRYYTFKDLGIDENKLLEKVKVIEGYVDFEDSQITSLANLEVIRCNAFFSNSQVVDLGNLKYIGSKAYIANSPLTVEDFNNVEVQAIVKEHKI